MIRQIMSLVLAECNIHKWTWNKKEGTFTYEDKSLFPGSDLRKGKFTYAKS